MKAVSIISYLKRYNFKFVEIQKRLASPTFFLLEYILKF